MSRVLSIGQSIVALGDSHKSSPLLLRLVGDFRSGFYLQCSEGVFAVSSHRIPFGPLHLIVGSEMPALQEGSVAELYADRLAIDDFVVDLRGASVWSPTLPQQTLDSCRLLASCVQDFSEVPTELVGRWDEVRAAVAQDNLEQTRLLLEGRGGGLTPVGDDVLAGVFLGDAYLDPDAARTGRRLDSARALRSTDLSRAFLYWAAQGQSIEPVHCMFHAAARSSGEDAIAHANEVVAIGSSSGSALLCGIGLVLDRPQTP